MQMQEASSTGSAQIWKSYNFDKTINVANTFFEMNTSTLSIGIWNSDWKSTWSTPLLIDTLSTPTYYVPFNYAPFTLYVAESGKVVIEDMLYGGIGVQTQPANISNWCGVSQQGQPSRYDPWENSDKPLAYCG